MHSVVTGGTFFSVIRILLPAGLIRGSVWFDRDLRRSGAGEDTAPNPSNELSPCRSSGPPPAKPGLGVNIALTIASDMRMRTLTRDHHQVSQIEMSPRPFKPKNSATDSPRHVYPCPGSAGAYFRRKGTKQESLKVDRH